MKADPYAPPTETAQSSSESRSWFSGIAMLAAIVLSGLLLLMTISAAYRSVDAVYESGLRRVHIYSLVLPLVPLLSCATMTAAFFDFRRDNLRRGIVWFGSSFALFFGIREFLWALLV